MYTFASTSCNRNKLRYKPYFSRHAQGIRCVTMPSEGDYFMTNRLKSIRRTILHVQPLLVIRFPTISKILKTHKKKTKLMLLVTCHLLKKIIYFVTITHAQKEF